MKYIIKFFPEIIVKSKSVRQEMSKVLQRNIRNVLNRSAVKVKIQDCWDKLVVRLDETDGPCPRSSREVAEMLCRIPGIHNVMETEEYEYSSMHDIYEKTAAVYGPQIAGKTFCVRVKRKGKQEFRSIDVEKYVGGGLNQNFPSAGVKLKDPDMVITLEIDNDRLFLITGIYEGLGGYPLSTQEEVLSLISGGFDSGVSSYMFIRRGCRVHYLFFNMGGNAHEIGVKQESYYIWDKFASSHKVRFISVPFEKMVGEILTKTDHSVRGVILKRMMMRIASIIAKKLKAGALVTGESLGQVSSQTLTNLSVIDRVTDTLILRPLIVTDKQDIIDKARDIGTIHFAETMPEYCGVISDRPTVKADVAFVEAEESKIDMSLIEELAEASVWMDIRDIPEDTKEMIGGEVEITDYAASNEVVVDIRAQDEIDAKPLVTDKPHLTIPFFKISSEFANLDQTKTYLLYCEKGVMSKMQAMYLKDQGFQNVKVFRLKEKQHGCCVAGL
ncbi:MAG: tRNA 4-thiouridine(8) synthase ThiI [Ruminobacter sp.]|jgi:thiamine biosynthesis protein ThiI|nr:tRNA 4-thiouridine(8) synthase ThiI [Ruminobacter sp.]